MLVLEGLALIVLSRVQALPLAIGMLMVFGLFVQASEGATFAVVPMINRRALGSVAGIVGAGGNVGAVVAGLLFRLEHLETPTVLLYLGCAVLVVSNAALLVRFTPDQEQAVGLELQDGTTPALTAR